MALGMENHMRRLLLLLIVPFAAGQSVLVAEAEVTEFLQPSQLTEYVPSGASDLPGIDCGDDHFTFNDADNWFRYREVDDGIGCAEARFAVTSPPGTKRIGFNFEADRDMRTSGIPGDSSFSQAVRVYPVDPNDPGFASSEYFSRTAPVSNLQEFDVSIALQEASNEHIVAWKFEEVGDGAANFPTPLTSISYTSSILNPAINYQGITLAVTESKGSIRTNENTEFAESIIRVQVPEELFTFGEVQIRLLLPANFRGIDVKTPDGTTLNEELVVNTVETGIELILAADSVHGGGIYEFKIVKQTALSETPFLWPLAITAMALPVVSGTAAVRETRRFRRTTEASSKSLAQSLDRGNMIAVICIILLLGWLIFFQRARLLATLPMQLEGILYYVLLAALAIGGFSIWFLTRYKLREIELDMEKLQDLSQIKSQMIGTMSHELNTPLTPMKMELDMLESGLMGDLSGEQKESVSSLQSSLSRLSHLVSDILDVSRSDSGQLKIIVEPMDLANLISEVKVQTRFAAKAKNVQLKYTGPKVLKLKADPLRLSQVLTNLIDNAIKFTPASGVIKISARDEGETVQICVVDSGQGMPVERLNRLFQPFGQIHEDAKTNRTGTGLGLYICKGIVEGHGGTIQAFSDGLGHGSTFEVRLPKEA